MCLGKCCNSNLIKKKGRCSERKKYLKIKKCSRWVLTVYLLVLIYLYTERKISFKWENIFFLKRLFMRGQSFIPFQKSEFRFEQVCYSYPPNKNISLFFVYFFSQCTYDSPTNKQLQYFSLVWTHLFIPNEKAIKNTREVCWQKCNRIHTTNTAEADGAASPKKTPVPVTSYTMPSSFLTSDILKHLCRELDRDKVEAEFSIKVSTTNLIFLRVNPSLL